MKTISRDASLNDFFTHADSHIHGFENVPMPAKGAGFSRYLPFSMILREAKAAMRRDLQAGVEALGGAFLGQGVEPDVASYLRPKSAVARLGATIKTGLKPPTSLPVLKSDFLATWLSELQSETPQDLNVAQALLSPHRVTACVTASKLLPIQSSPDFGALLADQATAKLMQALDQAALTGTGGAQPIGLFNTTNVQTVTFGARATWPTILTFENLIGNVNADGLNLGWAQSPNTRLIWKQVQRATGSSVYLQDDFNRVAGYQSAMTTELNSTNAGDRCVFGNWSDMVLGIFGAGVFVLKNPYTLAKNGEDQWTFTLFCDCGAIRPQSFVVSTDSAAQ